MRYRRYRKKPFVEARIGKSIRTYVIDAARRGMSQRRMAEELEVQPNTLGRWIEDMDLEQGRIFRRRMAE